MKIRVIITCISLLSVVKSQENLSWNGTASQSSTYYWEHRNINMTADLAITGKRTDTVESGQCAVTGFPPPDYFAWWMLTLPVDTVYVTNVRIYYRDNKPTRLAGYSLFISNSSTSKSSGYLCYHHGGPYIPSVLQNVNCNHLGQYVIIYNERNEMSAYPPGYSDFMVLELCHVEIYGCYKGWWGTSCNATCSANCISGHCYPGNGSCVWGCNSDNCLKNICDTDSGVCTYGCKIGLDGDSRDRACDSEKIGNNSSEACSHCFNQPCDPIAGTCPTGGCKRGYAGINCSTECSLGYYGYNCNESCDGCLSNTCDKVHGICTYTSGCKPGWQPGHEKCNLACLAGTYGQNCNEVCADKCYACHPVSGICLSGCSKGWMGPYCKQECITGRYGINCESHCHTCVNKTCDRLDGNCTHGCIDGFRGVGCHTTECITGRYGTNCESHCHTCVNKICDSLDGNCTHGCIDGYRGVGCHTTVTPQSDDQITNYIYIGVGTVLVVFICVIIFLFTLRYRRKKGDGSTKQQNGHEMGDLSNGTFTDYYTNIDAASADYVDTIPVPQEQPYEPLIPDAIPVVQDQRST